MTIAETLAKIQVLNQLWDDIEARKRRLRNELGELLATELDMPISSIVISSLWDCSKSPTKYCIYDRYKDPAHYQCVICGNPEERK